MAEFSDEARIRILSRRASWINTARPKQIVPEHEPNWLQAIYLAGRGFGKTRLAAEDMWWYLYEHPGYIGHVVAPTMLSDTRGVCFEGESGLLSVIPYEMFKGGIDKAYVKTSGMLSINLTNDSVIRGFAASEPGRLRGPQCHRLWGDEIAQWESTAPGNAEEAYNAAVLGCRLGDQARSIFTTTPKPLEIIREIVNDPYSIVINGSTHENLDNLAESFRRRVLKYEGTKYGRQEIYGELFDMEESGVIRRSWWRVWPRDKPLPVFDHIIMSLDTAFTEKTKDKKTHDPDPTACSVWGFWSDIKPYTSNGVLVRRRRDYCMLLDRWSDHLGMPDLIRRVKKERKNRYGAVQRSSVTPLIGDGFIRGSGKAIDVILIEDKGSGISLRQSLAEEGIQTMPYNPHRESKLQRLHAVSPIFARGQVYCVETDDLSNPGQPKDWARPLITQVCSFAGEKSLKHDDDVDTTTQALLAAIELGWLTVDVPDDVIERRSLQEAADVASHHEGNPYAI